MSAEWCQGYLVAMDEMLDFSVARIVAVLGLDVVYREANNQIQIWYLSIDTHFIVFHV
jgi:hypothetical protein